MTEEWRDTKDRIIQIAERIGGKPLYGAYYHYAGRIWKKVSGTEHTHDRKALVALLNKRFKKIAYRL